MWSLIYPPLTFLLLILSWSLFQRGREMLRKYPPGPWPWPVLGNVLKIRNANPNYPHLSFNTMAEKYGPVMNVKFGVHNTVVLSSYSAIKNVMGKTEVAGRYVMPCMTFHSGGKSNMGIAFNNGPAWQELSRFTLRTLKEIGFGKVGKMEQIQQEEASRFQSSLLKKMSSSEGTIFLTNLDFAESTVNILWGFIAGFRLPSDDPVVRRTVHYVYELFFIAGLSNLYNPFPWLKTLMPEWSGYNAHCKVHDGYQAFIKGMVDEVRNESKSGKSKDGFVHRFLEEIDRNADQLDTNFTEEQLIRILMELFIGATETNSGTLMWAVVYLTNHPVEQEKLFQEIKDVIGTNNMATYGDECRMPFTKACILETQRMGNVLPFGLPRLALKEFEGEGFRVNQGSMVFPNLHSVFRDKEYWGDPDVYRPGRFLDANSQILVEPSERVAMLFGAGRRSCVGESVATKTLFMYITTLFSKFQFSAIPGQEPSEVPLPQLLNLRPSNFHVHLKLRN